MWGAGANYREGLPKRNTHAHLSTYALTEIQLAHTGILHLFHSTKSLVGFNTEARGHIDRRGTREPDLICFQPYLLGLL